MIGILFNIIYTILGLFLVVLVIHVVISWLYAFGIIDRRNQVVDAIWRFTTAITDPMLRPLRRIIPPIAGVDLSVLVLMLVIILLRDSVLPWLYLLLIGQGSVL
jgi:YggT family protein